jgi:hypothetical protein
MRLFMNSAWLRTQLIMRSCRQESVEMGHKYVRYKQKGNYYILHIAYVLVYPNQGDWLCG